MLNIIVVDDSTVIRKILTRELTQMGHTVVAEAKSGKEAIELYRKFLPDLVTMDITMPGINGIDALKSIKNNYKDANIIMITSHGEEALVMDAIISGAKGYVLKPIKTFELELAINKVFFGEENEV